MVQGVGSGSSWSWGGGVHGQMVHNSEQVTESQVVHGLGQFTRVRWFTI